MKHIFRPSNTKMKDVFININDGKEYTVCGMKSYPTDDTIHHIKVKNGDVTILMNADGEIDMSGKQIFFKKEQK